MGGDDSNSSDVNTNNDLTLRSIAHRMSQGIDIKTRTYGLLHFRNVFLGKDAVEWLIADPKSGVDDLDGAIQAGQKLIDNGYVVRVSRELKAQEVRHFGRAQKAKKEFRGGDSIYRFDTLRISPFLLHVVVCRARKLKSHDFNGKNDPYVKLRLGKQRAVTRVQLKTNQPVWNEHFVFGVNSVEAQQLHLTVCDYDKYKHDDLIGSCHVGLSHLPCETVAGERGDASALSPAGLYNMNGGMGCGMEGTSCPVRGSNQAPHGRHDERRSALAHTEEDDEITPLHKRDSLGSDRSVESGITLPTKIARSYTVGDSEHSDIDPDEWEAASDVGGVARRGGIKNGGGSHRSVFGRGSEGSGRPRRRRRRKGSSVSASVKKIVPWVKTKKSASNSSYSSAEHQFNDSDEDEDGHSHGDRHEHGKKGLYATKRHTKRSFGGEDDMGRGVVVDGRGSGAVWGGTRVVASSLPPVHGSEEAITFYPLMLEGGSDCRTSNALSSRSGHGHESSSREESKEAKDRCCSHEGRHQHGELGCDIWLTSFTPRPLPVQGEAKFSLRCRICYMSGVTSSEERNIGEFTGTSIRQKVLLMLNGDSVYSSSCERGKDKQTMFNGAVISVDTKANMATDMLKFVVQQRINPVELVYKPVATVSIPLRSMALLFPSDEKTGENGTSKSDACPVASSIASQFGGASPSASSGDPAGSKDNSAHDSVGRGETSCSVTRAPWHQPGEPRPRQYRLQTLAGPLTSRTMDNGFVTMSLMLVPSGNDLLGEQEPVDSEPVEGALPEFPERLGVACVDSSLGCGYQRLRKALLWNESKLMAAYGDVMEYTETSAEPWVDKDGSPGHQENMSGCTRQRSFVVPKSSMAAATKAQASEAILLDGPTVMAYESRVRTPAVPFGDKFEVVTQFLLYKEGPEKCHLAISSDAVFSEKVMGLIQGQIVSAVSKVSKDSYQQLLELIEDALSGRAGPNNGGRGGRRKKRAKRSLFRWLVVLVVFTVISLALAYGALLMFGPKGESQDLLAVPGSLLHSEDRVLSSPEEGTVPEEDE